jgi:hypothetical protein
MPVKRKSKTQPQGKTKPVKEAQGKNRFPFLVQLVNLKQIILKT